MSRVCHFTGKKTRAGRSLARRGKAKYLGGVGRKTTGISKRKFKPNIQRVRAVVDGKVCRVQASAKAIKMGLVVKPPKRHWPGAKKEGHQAAATPTPKPSDHATPTTSDQRVSPSEGDPASVE